MEMADIFEDTTASAHTTEFHTDVPDEIIHQIMRECNQKHKLNTFLALRATCRSMCIPAKLQFKTIPTHWHSPLTYCQIFLDTEEIGLLRIMSNTINIELYQVRTAEWNADGLPRVQAYSSTHDRIYVDSFYTEPVGGEWKQAIGRMKTKKYVGNPRTIEGTLEVFWTLCVIIIPQILLDDIYDQVQLMRATLTY